MGPFMKDKDNTTAMMFRLVIALLPIVIYAFYKNGVVPFLKDYTDVFRMLYPLIFILVATVSTFVFESLYLIIFEKKRKLKDFIVGSYSFIPGLFLGLILPMNTPIPIVIMGAFFATIIGKMLFGGFGKNIFNPALIGSLFVTASYAAVIANNGGCLNPYELDTITSSTPLAHASVVEGIGTYRELVGPYGGLFNFFIGNTPGTLGETSSILCIIAFIYLTITKTIKWRIPATYVLTVFLMTMGIGFYNHVGIWYPVFQVLSGGLLFGAVFMATDPVTSPVTRSGQVLYGVMLGILTVVLRYLSSYPEGVLTSILTMNMLVFILDVVGAKARFKKSKLIIPSIVLVLIAASMTFVIAKDKGEVDDTDPNFEIIDVAKNGKDATYVVAEKGFSSKIKLEVIIKNNKITSIEVLEQDDSFFSKVEDAAYNLKLINKQQDLESCDTVSGATISSTAMKKAVMNVLKDWEGK